MNPFSSRISMLAAVVSLAVMPAWAEQAAEQSVPADEVSSETAANTFSQQDLDQVLAPIALYPDDLLAQVLMASTYPLEIVQAARWQSANPGIKGKALEDEMQKQPWDPSVKAITAVPQVLKQMNDNLDWTQKLGDAFLAQKEDVMATVQQLRAKADAAGNLKSTPEQNVTVQPWPTSTVYNASTPQPEKVYVIQSAQPEVVYVPAYNPTVVYGSWWYPAPPYYVYPPSYAYAPGVAFATGLFVGAAIWGNCNWHNGDVDIDVNRYNNFNRSNVSNRNWNHNVEHRKGVAYQDRRVAQQYNRGASTRDVQSRDQFRGRTEAGDRGRSQGQVGTSDRGAGSRDFGDGGRTQGHVGTSDRGGGSRDFGSGGRSQGQAGTSDRSAGTSGFGGRGQASGNRGGGLSGMNSGASTRAASSRGGASRGGMSRGGGGRGRR